MNHEQMIKPALIGVGLLAVLVVAGLPIAYLGFGLLILACPVMMFFMMRSMGHGEEKPKDHQTSAENHTTVDDHRMK